MTQIQPVAHVEHDDSFEDEDDLVHSQCLRHLKSVGVDEENKVQGCCLPLRQHLQKSLHSTLYRADSSKKFFIIKVLEAMESPKFELSVVFLVMIDLFMVSFEILIDALFVFPHADGHRRLSETPASELIQEVGRPATGRFLGSSEGGSCNIAMAKKIAGTCRWISISILFFFAIELIIKVLIAPKAFFKHLGHIFDVVVIFGSIVLEFTLHHSVGGLLIFFRSWRFIRIAHAMYEEAEFLHKSMETKVHLEKAASTIGQYKEYHHARDLRHDFKMFKKSGKGSLEGTRVRISVVKQDSNVEQATLEGSANGVKAGSQQATEPPPPGAVFPVLPNALD